MTTRDGRLVAGHFGSPATEAAVCRSGVGMIDRCVRATFEVVGAPEAVDQALEGLEAAAAPAWSARLAPERGLVRCEPGAMHSALRALGAPGLGMILNRTGEDAAVGLVGPRASDLLGPARFALPGGPLVVLCEGPERYEILVPAARGPELWYRLLDLGEPYDLACVGIEALEHLDAGARIAGVPQAAPPTS